MTVTYLFLIYLSTDEVFDRNLVCKINFFKNKFIIIYVTKTLLFNLSLSDFVSTTAWINLFNKNKADSTLTSTHPGHSLVLFGYWGFTIFRHCSFVTATSIFVGSSGLFLLYIVSSSSSISVWCHNCRLVLTYM